MRQKRNRLLALLLAMVMALTVTGCGAPSATDAMDDGADAFAHGKDEEDYSFSAAARALSALLDDYSGSMGFPTGSQMDDTDLDDAKRHIHGNPDPADPDPGDTSADPDPGDTSADPDPSDTSTDPDPGDTSVTVDIPVITNETEFMQLLHRAFDETQEYVVFRTDGIYTVDLGNLEYYYLLLEREDPADVNSLISWMYSFPDDENTSYLTLTYGTDVDELKDMKAQTKTLVKRAAAKLNTSGKSEYDIVCMVNDYLCDTVYYPDTQPYPTVTHTGYGAFADGCAVCEGYAIAAKLLLNELGVTCDIEFGFCTNGGGHAWNLVQVDGLWYQLDITWNDGGDDRTAYLLTTDDYMRQSRTWDESLYPACTDTTYHA